MTVTTKLENAEAITKSTYLHYKVIKRKRAVYREISASRRRGRYFAIYSDPECDNFITKRRKRGGTAAQLKNLH